MKEKEEAQAMRKSEYGWWYFMKYTTPFLFKGGCIIKLQTTISFFLLFLSKVLNVSPYNPGLISSCPEASD
jgi:hypothetical protein